MKAGTSLLVFLFFVSCASGKQKMYTASTPADTLVRKFLDIPLADSVDFIRWKLVLSDTHYALRCTYGIGKKNTNGFINGGKTISISGTIKKEKNKFFLYNGDNYLQVLVLNDDLLHIVNADQSLVVGNGGWSYTLNNMTPLGIEQINISAKPVLFNDSMAFEGRTPCAVPGIIPAGKECYKLKWVVIFYGNAEKNEQGRYKMYGISWRKPEGRTGKWRIKTSGNGHITYRLDDENGKGFLYLLQLDDGVFVFTDSRGKLLVGNEDFSYTLNRTFRNF